MNEAKYISETPLAYRRQYGQFFTPEPIAKMMVEWISQDSPRSILDPAFGLGIFYQELIKINPHSQSHFTGYEIDKHILSYLTNLKHCQTATHQQGKGSKGLTLINGDYLAADLEPFDGIIGNPPYRRFQKFLNRQDILPKIEAKIGHRIVGYTNLASVFLLKALSELKPQGRLAFIMPFEFFNTGYGQDVKKTLIEKHLLKKIITFANEKDVFPEATTTVCIIFCQNNDLDDEITISFSNKDTEYQVKSSSLDYRQKWTPIFCSLTSQIKEGLLINDFTKISHYGRFVRGIATGANQFFALSKTKIKEVNLRANNLRQCITKSSQIKTPVLTDADLMLLYNSDRAVYCLDVQEPTEPEMIKYLQEGEAQKFHQRYLTKNRQPWYKLEQREPAPLLFGVFSRDRLKVIRNYTQAINFTCFHGFYPNLIGEKYLDRLFVYLLSDRGQAIVKMNKRSYGDALDKLEPGDLNNCLCPRENQLQLILDWETREVIELAKKDLKEAVKMSDRLVDRIFKIVPPHRKK